MNITPAAFYLWVLPPMMIVIIMIMLRTSWNSDILKRTITVRTILVWMVIFIGVFWYMVT